MTPITLIIASLIAISSNSAVNLDSMLTVQRERAGVKAEEIFTVLDREDLADAERNDLRFLMSYLPLGDLAMMNGKDLLENVLLAREAVERFSWGSEVPEDIYLNFVLPHRVSQEPFVRGWRRMFLDDIAPRVAGMTMSEAALEVNHWCHEHATFKVSSRRDQDVLTTIRAGLGRCEEEMILTICALRSVSIPARQCYTPYWPHTDNNHAWVEVWADGEWHYYGGCEPKPGLEQAWFTSAAGRAMLVVSTAYGEYLGDEPVLKNYPRSTLINSTAVYGPTHEINITLTDRKDRPVKDTRMVFSLFNYGALMPALALNSDDEGRIVLNCGKGSWIAAAAKKKESMLLHIPGDQDEVTVKLMKTKKLERPTTIEYVPPPGSPDRDKVAMDSLFKCRLAMEDSIREASFWSVWASEVGIDLDSGFAAVPDSFLAQEMAERYGLDSAKTLEIFTNARGNWGHLYRFLTGTYPGIPAAELFTSGEVGMRFILLETLSEKDLRDFSIEALEDHYNNTTLSWNLAQLTDFNEIGMQDSSTRERIKDYVIAPRINYEPSSGWREPLIDFLGLHPKFILSKKDKKLLKWLRKNITIEEKSDRLGPSLTPDAVLSLRRSRRGDLERLYVGLCRVRGIPARFDPVSDRLEVWREDEWQAVKVLKDKSGGKKAAAKGSLSLAFEAPDSVLEKTLYLRDWAVQEWRGDLASVVDFGYKEPFSKIEWPQELPVGLYCLTTGHRREDGSAPIMLTWFDIEAGKEVKLELKFIE